MNLERNEDMEMVKFVSLKYKFGKKETKTISRVQSHEQLAHMNHEVDFN